MIFVFPGRMSPDDLDAEIARAARFLITNRIEAIFNVFLRLEMIHDEESVEFLDAEYVRLELLYVPQSKIPGADQDSDYDQFEKLSFSLQPTIPLSFRHEDRARRLRTISGAYRAPPCTKGSALRRDGATTTQSLGDDIPFAIDILGGLWELNEAELACLIGGNEEDLARMREEPAPSADLGARVGLLYALQHELYLSRTESYPAWWRRPWRPLSPIGAQSPLNAVLSDGAEVLTVICSHLQLLRLQEVP